MLEKINIRAPILNGEPMSRHTTFRVGGPADYFIAPRCEEDLKRIWTLGLEQDIPLFVLGAGANILVADRGIRGIVLDLGALGTDPDNGDGAARPGPDGTVLLAARAGAQVDAVCARALRLGLTGIEFLTAMPGSIGGAIWMNARCYDVSFSDVLEEVEILDEGGVVRPVPARPQEFGYKRSPFQRMKAIILRGLLRLRPGDPRAIAARMEELRLDRERKGHFLHPSAGSVFKNCHAFGQPTGKIIDSLGLRGCRLGGAQVSDRHANIIVNRGGARAADIHRLIRRIEDRVRDELGLVLEREILLVGDWEGEA